MSPIITPVTARFKQTSSSSVLPGSSQQDSGNIPSLSAYAGDGDNNSSGLSGNQNPQKQNLFQQGWSWVQKNIAALLVGAGSVGGIGGATYLVTKKDSGGTNNNSPSSTPSQNNLPSSPTPSSPNQPSNNRNPGNSLSVPFEGIRNIVGKGVNVVGGALNSVGGGAVKLTTGAVVGSAKLVWQPVRLTALGIEKTGSLLMTPVQDLAIIKYPLNQWKAHKETKKTEEKTKADQAFETRRQAHVNSFQGRLQTLTVSPGSSFNNDLDLANYHFAIDEHSDALPLFNNLSSYLQRSLEQYIQDPMNGLASGINEYPEILLKQFLAQYHVDPTQLNLMLINNLKEINKYLQHAYPDNLEEASALHHKAILLAAAGEDEDAKESVNESIKLLDESYPNIFKKPPEIHEYKQLRNFFEKMFKSRELHELLPKILKGEDNDFLRFRKEALLRNVFHSYRHHIAAHP